VIFLKAKNALLVWFFNLRNETKFWGNVLFLLQNQNCTLPTTVWPQGRCHSCVRTSWTFTSGPPLWGMKFLNTITNTSTGCLWGESEFLQPAFWWLQEEKQTYQEWSSGQLGCCLEWKILWGCEKSCFKKVGCFSLQRPNIAFLFQTGKKMWKHMLYVIHILFSEPYLLRISNFCENFCGTHK